MLSEDATLAIDAEKYACYPIENAEAQVGFSGTPDDHKITADYSIIPLVQTAAGIKEDYTKCKSAANRFSKPNE